MFQLPVVVSVQVDLIAVSIVSLRASHGALLPQHQRGCETVLQKDVRAWQQGVGSTLEILAFLVGSDDWVLKARTCGNCFEFDFDTEANLGAMAPGSILKFTRTPKGPRP